LKCKILERLASNLQATCKKRDIICHNSFASRKQIIFLSNFCGHSSTSVFHACGKNLASFARKGTFSVQESCRHDPARLAYYFSQKRGEFKERLRGAPLY